MEGLRLFSVYDVSVIPFCPVGQSASPRPACRPARPAEPLGSALKHSALPLQINGYYRPQENGTHPLCWIPLHAFGIESLSLELGVRLRVDSYVVDSALEVLAKPTATRVFSTKAMLYGGLGRGPTVGHVFPKRSMSV